MKLITLYLPEPYIRALDRLVNEKRIYPNRAEAIRIAVRDLLNEEALLEVRKFGENIQSCK